MRSEEDALPMADLESASSNGSPATSRIPRSLKLAVFFFLVYAVVRSGVAVLYATLGGLPPIASGQYMGQATAILFWAGVVTWALLRRKKYGWGFSVVVVVIRAVIDTKGYIENLPNVSSGAVAFGTTFVFAMFILPLIGTLVALAKPASREPFRRLSDEAER